MLVMFKKANSNYLAFPCVNKHVTSEFSLSQVSCLVLGSNAEQAVINSTRGHGRRFLAI